jgi:hypothetical protein
VIATGYKPESSLFHALADHTPEIYLIGDALKADRHNP